MKLEINYNDVSIDFNVREFVKFIVDKLNSIMIANFDKSKTINLNNYINNNKIIK